MTQSKKKYLLEEGDFKLLYVSIIQIVLISFVIGLIVGLQF